MNHGTIRWFTFCVSVVLLAGCQSNTSAFIPITGVEEAILPAPVVLARDQVLDYLVSSAHLAGLPSNADWRHDAVKAPDGEYRLRSGDWLMMIRSAKAQGDNQLVMLLNQVDRASWTGYITPDGRVVDTAYYR
jgi:hypothetical protein